jgi:hypothetical protein
LTENVLMKLELKLFFSLFGKTTISWNKWNINILEKISSLLIVLKDE